MRTLLISDLHLGSASRTDLLSRPDVRARLLEAVSGADRVVLLGDALELRHVPARDALAAARPFFAELGHALAGGELVVVAGNHDHALIAPWLARRSEEAEPRPLALESLVEAADASPMLARLAQAATPARVLAAYPGLWVREDVYATHGHYLDCHLTLPTLERLSVGFMCRLLARPPEDFASVEDYEAVTAPLYAWRHSLAQSARTNNVLNGVATVEVWNALRSRGTGPRSFASANGAGPRRRGGAGPRRRERLAGARRALTQRALVAAFPLAIAALNRAGIGPLRPEISASELRRSGLRAMAEVGRRLALDDSYVVFGHTHRAGPLPGDTDPQWAELHRADRARAGARLINTGCWTYDAAFLTARPGESPYWPGTCVVVEDTGPPRLERLLLDRTHEQLGARA